MHTDVNEQQECFISYDQDYYVYLRFSPCAAPPGILPIRDYEVPLPLLTLSHLKHVFSYDSQLLNISDHIDGRNCVRKIE